MVLLIIKTLCIIIWYLSLKEVLERVMVLILSSKRNWMMSNKEKWKDLLVQQKMSNIDLKLREDHYLILTLA